jgi:Mn-dependent DtxR family transcriptional regulator
VRSAGELRLILLRELHHVGLVRAVELAPRLGLSYRSVTTVLGRLEAEGLARKVKALSGTWTATPAGDQEFGRLRRLLAG